jgi:hypothetical protein
MTPQEQFDYKLSWKPGHIVRLHSDLDNEGKTWCKRNLERDTNGVLLLGLPATSTPSTLNLNMYRNSLSMSLVNTQINKPLPTHHFTF